MFVSSIRKVLLLALLVGSVSAKAKDTDCNSHPEQQLDTIHLVSQHLRFAVEGNGDRIAHWLCNLIPGKRYHLFLNPDLGSTEYTARLALPLRRQFIASEQNRELSFQARSTCERIEIVRPANAKGKGHFVLSIGCDDCESESLNNRSVAGITTDDGRYSPEELIQEVFIGGDCFDVNSGSISFTGEREARGYFSNGSSSINIEEGVMLATGDISNAHGPNQAYNRGTSFFNPSTNDPDLRAIINSSNLIYDATALEFDFTPTSDTVSFEFVFASEEYCEYAGSQYNDVFGFFISGPGINGPFSNNAENIAFVPGSSDYVTINNVNHSSNPNYYVSNVPSQQHSDMPSWLDCPGHSQLDGIAINDIEFDGFTTLMTAIARVQACETYHIKLIVADVNDAYYDSAVFLKANSFSAGGTALVTTDVPDFGGDIAYEGCKDGAFVFRRTNDDLSDEVIVNFNISTNSTALEGIDFDYLPSSVTILPGDSLVVLPVSVFDDILIEGNESVILELDAPCSCNIPSTVLYISDMDSLEIILDDAYLCESSSLALEPQISGGIPGYSYLWSTNETQEDINVNPTQDTTYSLMVTDACGNTATSEVEVEIIGVPTAFISGYEEVCPGNPNTTFAVEFTGDGPWAFNYTINNGPEITVNNITNNPYLLPVSTLGTYLLTEVNSLTCQGTFSGTATLAPVEITLAMTPTMVSCPEADDGQIDLVIAGGQSPYSFQWDNGGGINQNPTGLAEGTYQVIITDANGCTAQGDTQVGLHPDVPQVEAGMEQTINCTDLSVRLLGSGSSGGDYDYRWSTREGNIVSGETTNNPVVNLPGIYQFIIINTQTGCQQSDEVKVNIDTISPEALIQTLGPLTLDCNLPTTILDGASSGPAGNISFTWTSNGGSIPPGSMNLPQFEISAPGTYTLEIQNQTNGCKNSASIEIETDMDLPSISIIPPSLLTCEDSIVTIDAGASSSGSRFTYVWSTPDGNIISGINGLQALVNLPGIYTLSIRDEVNGCGESGEIEVLTDLEPPLVDAGEAGEELDCDTPEITLEGNASAQGNGFSIHWTSIDGNITSGINSLNPAVDDAGIYTLTVTSLKNGCTATDDVTVSENTNVPTDLEIIAMPPLCYGGEGSMTVASVVGGEGPYLYALDGGPFFNAPDVFDALLPGDYNLRVQDLNGCEYEELFTIPTTPPFIVDLEAEVEIQLGHYAELNANTNFPMSLIDTIIWNPIDSLSCTNCLNPLARPVENTLYEITLIDVNGCIAKDEVLIKVDKTRKIFIPNAFTPNSDGFNDEFLIYADALSVKRIRQLQVFNRWGETVFQSSNSLPNTAGVGWDGRMNGELLNPAVFVYFAEIEFVDGVTRLYKGDVTILD